MKAGTKSRFIVPVFACALLAGACGILTAKGSGQLVTMTVPVETFSRMEVSHGFDVHLSAGATEKVTLRLDDNLVDDLDVAASDGTLRLRMSSRRPVRDATLRADVVARPITSIRADSGSKLQMAGGLSVDAVSLSLSGGSSLDGAVATEKVNLGMSGGSRSTLRGNASALEVAASGGSVLEGGELRVQDAQVQLSGGARASTAVSSKLSVEVTGASSFSYVGSPTFVRRDVSGNSSITNG